MSYKTSDLLEFWGRMLLQTSQGLHTAEQFSEFLESCQPASQQPVAALGQGHLPTDWAEWGELLRMGLAAWGLTFLDPCGDLEAKRQELEQKCAAQEEEINNLRLTLGERGMGLEHAQRQFQNIIKKQGEQFEDFMKGLGSQLAAGNDPDPR